MGHREDLLAAARALLTEKGYAHTTARDLVAKSGTNLASIGYHFGSKAGLLTAAIGEAFNEWAVRLARAALSADAATPFDRATATWSEALRGLPEQQPLIVAFAEALAQAERAPELRARFAEQYQAMRGRVASYVAEALGGHDGSAAAPPSDDPRLRAIASFMMAVCDGFAIQYLIDSAHTPTPEELQGGLALLLPREAP
jgi:AcrR family transcriptional regulator